MFCWSLRGFWVILFFLVGLSAAVFAQAPGGSLSGRVMSATGTPVVGALLALISESGAAVMATADADGFFRFDKVAPGQYRLQAAGVGLSPIAHDVTVASGEALKLELMLLSVVHERVMVIVSLIAGGLM